ncbi:MAG TPA: hypothetical protein VFJ06_13635 [Halococcus sp.]|nr:hypothetical protein [Halococcus sp.]
MTTTKTKADGDNEKWSDERCGRCESPSNVFHGFVHDVADEPWTNYAALCRGCFIEEAGQ